MLTTIRRAWLFQLSYYSCYEHSRTWEWSTVKKKRLLGYLNISVLFKTNQAIVTVENVKDENYLMFLNKIGEN